MIGELASKTRLTTKAIRFYEAQGLLQSPARTAGGYRDYREDAMARISFIRAGQAIGLTLGELREIIAFRDHGQAPCVHVAALLEQKATEVALRIAELVELQETLQELRDRAAHLDPAECPPDSVCHLIWPKLPVSGRP
ncbi:MAG: heavy metal-responsive transcriptional regulator [Thermaerobacter sp.]|nr:heavy metal-responsive transcriptional regulator [Thermaerobacter sp.]